MLTGSSLQEARQGKAGLFPIQHISCFSQAGFKNSPSFLASVRKLVLVVSLHLSFLNLIPLSPIYTTLKTLLTNIAVFIFKKFSIAVSFPQP